MADDKDLIKQDEENENSLKIFNLCEKLKYNSYDNEEKCLKVDNMYRKGFRDEDHLRIPQYIILPMSAKKFYWDLINYIFAFYSLGFIPIEIGFSKKCLMVDGIYSVFNALDIITAIVFSLTIVLKFFIPFYNKKGHLEFHMKEIAKSYLKSDFIFDLMAAIPWSLIFSVGECGKATAIRLKIPLFFALFQFNKISELNRLIENTNSKYINVYRLIKLLLFFFYVCLFMGSMIVGGTSKLISQLSVKLNKSLENFIYVYAWSIYNGIILILGTDPGVDNPNEKFLIIFVEIVSMAITANVFGYIALILEKINSSDMKNSINLRNRLDLVNEYLLYENINEDLRVEVNEFYKFMHIRQRFLFEKDIYKHLNGNLLARVKFELWKNSYFVKDTLFCENIISSLFFEKSLEIMSSKIYKKGDIIFEEGEISFDLFLICTNSSCEIYCQGLLMNILKEGQFFGETAIFTSSKKRTATVINKTDGDFLIIPGKEFYRLILDFEEERNFFSKIAIKYLNSYNQIIPPNAYNLFISKNEKVFKSVIQKNLFKNPSIHQNSLFYKKNFEDIDENQKHNLNNIEKLYITSNDRLEIFDPKYEQL